jgi:hypothetical protein
LNFDTGGLFDRLLRTIDTGRIFGICILVIIVIIVILQAGRQILNAASATGVTLLAVNNPVAVSVLLRPPRM